MKKLLFTVFLVASLAGSINAHAGVTVTWLSELADSCQATLVQGTNASWYGTAVGGTAIQLGKLTTNYGSVFLLFSNPPSPPFGRGGYASTNMHTFTNTDGGAPNAGVVIGPGGSLYGTTARYGATNALFPGGMGSLYSVGTTQTNQGILGKIYPFKRLYRFGSNVNAQGQPLDGASPISVLVPGGSNVLYGTTSQGGSNGYSGGGLGYGTAFKINTNGTLTQLYSFAGSDGAYPTALTFGVDGNLYGVTSFGGSNTTVVETNGAVGFGTVYRMTTNGSLTLLYSFGAAINSAGGALDGGQPNPLVLGADSNFYGTSAYGGSNTTTVDSNGDIGYGTFFRITTNGALTTLYSFGTITNSTGRPLDGGNPVGALVQGSDGNFFGVSQFGGLANTGTVFRITPQGSLTTLYSFGTNSPLLPPGGFEGLNPRAGLAVGADGNLYGTTYKAGGGTPYLPQNRGSAFRIGPAVPAFSSALGNRTIVAGATNVYSATVNSIYATACQWQFDGTDLSDGGNISGSATPTLTITGATAANAGTYTVVASNAAGSANMSSVLTVVPAIIESEPVNATVIAGATNEFSVAVDTVLPVSFQWQFDGTNLSDGGNISGSTTSNLTVYSAMPANAGIYSVVISNAAGLVTSSSAVLTVDPFMIITPAAGAAVMAGSPAYLAIAVQSYVPVAYQWQFDGGNLHNNNRISGANSNALTVNNTGPADAGTYTVIVSNAVGVSNYSAVLIVLQPTTGGTVLKTVYSFTGYADGAHPSGALLPGTNSLFYGTALDAGTYGDGTIYSWSSGAGLSTIYAFGAQASDGINPTGALVQDSLGNFYGTTTEGGGSGNAGVVYELTSSDVMTNLVVEIAGATDSQNTLTPGGSNTLYCLANEGTLYEVTNEAAEMLATNLAIPCAVEGLLSASSGELYGVTGCGGSAGDGLLFALSTNGTVNSLFSFGGAAGGSPNSALVPGLDGALYGTTADLGARGFGTIFRYATNGAFSVLYSFGVETNWDGTALDGSQPNALLFGNDGNIYGTTAAGGYAGNGTVFRLTPGGSFATLIYFDGTNGANPQAPLVLGSDGAYYGTTSGGGTYSDGTIFRLLVAPALTQPVESNGLVAFQCTGVIGESYQLQASSSLTASGWQNVGSPVVAGSPMIAFTDTILSSRRFYRVVWMQN